MIVLDDKRFSVDSSPYTGLANVYDELTEDDLPDKWIGFLAQQQLLPNPPVSLGDLGCGTGVLAVRLAQRGYHVVGVDNSSSMLTFAHQRAMEEKVKVRWLNQDMRYLRWPQGLPAPAGFLCTRDALNYMPSCEDLLKLYHCVYGLLDKNGWFAFDVLGPMRIQQLQSGAWHVVDDEMAIIHATEVDVTGKIYHDVTGFQRLQGNNYQRFDEHHIQMFYPQNDIEGLLKEAGFAKILAFGDFGESEISLSDRMTFVAIKK